MPGASALATRRTTRSGACVKTRPGGASGSPAECVAGAADSLNQTRATAGLELVAQILDANVDQVRITQIVEAPHVLKYLFAGQHLARMAQEQLEELIFARGELEQVAITASLSGAGHQLDVLKTQDFDLAWLDPT